MDDLFVIPLDGVSIVQLGRCLGVVFFKSGLCYVGEGQIEEKQLILAILPANAVPQLERAWLNRRGQWQFTLVIQVAFYLAAVTDPMEDRVKGLSQTNRSSLPSHTSLTYDRSPSPRPH